MNAGLDAREEDAATRERRCIVTGEILPDDARVRFVADGFDVALDVIPIAAHGLADVDNHIDFHRAILARQFSFVALRFRGAIAMGKANHTAHQHASAFEQFGRALDGIRLDANRSHAVLRSNPATIIDLLIRQRRLQERMINHFGKLFVSVFHNDRDFLIR